MVNQFHYRYVNFIKDRFTGKDVHIVASGPSLLGFDYSLLEDKTVVAVNHSHKKLKQKPEYVVFIDKGFPAREDQSIVNSGIPLLSRYNKDNQNIISFDFGARFSFDPAYGVYSRRSSGIAAITTALQGGATRVFLYGFDCRGVRQSEAIDIVNRNGGDPNSINLEYYLHCTDAEFNHQKKDRFSAILFSDTIPLFSILPKDRIFNCSEISAIPYFQKIDYRDILKKTVKTKKPYRRDTANSFPFSGETDDN